MKWLVLAARLILGGMFLCAGLIKAGGNRDFAMALAPFLNLPAEWLRPISIVLILAEILTGALTLAPRIYPLGALGALILCLLYAGVISWGLVNGIIVDCGCFGSDAAPSAGKMEVVVVRDVIMAGFAALILIHWKIRRAAAPVSPALQGAP